MSEMQERAMKWLFSDDTGSSSEAIMKHMLSISDKCYSYPSDVSDLGRCLRLLELFPDWKPRISEMAQYSPGWAGQVAIWYKLEAMMIEECGIDGSKAKRAPETYKAMKLAQANGYRNDKRYRCTFAKDGTLSSAFMIDED